MAWVLRLIAVAAVPALLAGCGGDDDAPITPVTTETAPVEALTKDDFIEQADDICEEANTALANVTVSGAADTSAVVSQQSDIVEGMRDQLQALGAPEEDAQQLDEFFNSLKRWVANLRKQELAARRDDTAMVTELAAEESSIKADFASAADEYGMKECGQEGEATATGTDMGTGAPPAAPVAPSEPAPPPAPAPAPPAPAPAPPPPSGGAGSGGGGGGGGGSGGVSP